MRQSCYNSSFRLAITENRGGVMEFIVNISEKEIQKVLDKLLATPIHYTMRGVIDRSVAAAVEAKIKDHISSVFSEAIDSAIKAEIEKCAAQKITGWAKRRIKEMLEDVRLSNFEAKP